jgi:hypothetical protein
VAALGNSALDAGVAVEPLVGMMESRGIAMRAFDVLNQVWKDQASLVLVGPSLLSRPDAAGTAFMVGFLRGLRDVEAALQDQKVVEPALHEIISRWTNIPAEVVARASFSGAPPNGRILLDDLVRQQDFWLQEGDVRARADLNAFVEYKYLDAAIAQLR